MSTRRTPGGKPSQPTGSGRSPLQTARWALGRGRRLDADLEVYVQHGRTVEVKAFQGEVESASVAEPRGLGVRAVRGGRVGYAFTADLSATGVDRTLAEALANLEAADADPFMHLPKVSPDHYPAPPGLWRPGVANTSLEDKIRLALEAEAAALALPEIESVETSVYSDEEARVAVASTTGVEAEAEQSFCVGYVVALAGRGDERQSGLGFCTGRDPGELDAEAAGRDAAERARALLGARPCRTGSYTVVFDREIAAALLAGVVQALSADSVQKGRSVFAGRLGETVGSTLLTLLDDGLAAGGMATSPFDGEGVPQRTTPLIDTGVLLSYLHNSYTAAKAGDGTRSTGNGTRGSYRLLPGVGATNLVVRPGEGTLGDLVARVGEGLYVQDAAGLNSGVNPISGEVSIGVTGRLIQGGGLSDPVREVTIACDYLQLLGSVCDLASDTRWIPLHGSVQAPSIAVRDIAVSGV
ncbi:MAG: TldD/PmbA family protein [Thermoleophilia bacterium]|nr:TldD/PmbA family protein [Thermoleophilia bacterium]